MRKICLVLLLLVSGQVYANPSQLSGAAGGVCDGDNHVIRVSGMYFWGIDGEYTGMVLERQAIGLCAPSEFLDDFTAEFVPEPSYDYAASWACTFTVPAPAEEAVYRYVPHAVKADGSLHRLIHYCDSDWRSYALVGCGEVPFIRGTVELGYMGYGEPSFRIVSCEDDCWSEGVGTDYMMSEFEELIGESPFGWLGEVVDVYGERTYCTMPGGPYERITKIERAPGGTCGPVPVSQESWGSLKALYR